jgi:hypothetical protein
MFELLLNPHLKILDLSEVNMLPINESLESLCIVRLASVRCSVKINSSFLYSSELMTNFLQQQLTKLKMSLYNWPQLPSNQVEDTFTLMLQLFEHLQILDLSFTIYGASCMLKLGSTSKPKIR